MRPRTFEYYAPTQLGEALSLLSKFEDAKILAGGQSIITLMKLRLTSPSSLIDINRIKELNYIRDEGNSIAIGALTRHDQIASNVLIRQRCTLLAEAASMIADQQVRNRGSIGGSLAHADPSADLPTACTALDAQIVTTSEQESRSVAAKDFFLDFFTTALKQNEIIKEVRVPLPSKRSGGAYAKVTKGHNDFAIVAVAAQTSFDESGTCENASVVLGGYSIKPIHATETERILIGKKIDDQTIREAASKAAGDSPPTPDNRATPDLKSKLAKSLAERTLRSAVTRAKGAN